MTHTVTTLSERATVAYKEGDNLPVLEDVVLDTDGHRENLSGFDSVRFYMEFVTDDPDASNVPVANDPATFDDKAEGEISYQLSEDHLSNAGRYEAEWVLETSGGDIRSYPQSTNIVIDVRDPLDRDVPLEDIEVDGDLSLTSLDADEIDVDVELTIPSYDTASSATGAESSLIFTDDEGFMAYDADSDSYEPVSGGTGTNTHVDVTEDGTLVLADPGGLDFDGDDFDVTDNEDGTATVTFTGSASGGSIEVAEAGTVVASDASQLDFDGGGFDITEDAEGNAFVTNTADGDGTTNTHVTVTEDGTAVVVNPDELDFDASDFSVTDNEDSTVTVTFDGDVGDPVDVSEGGTGVVTDASEIDFDTDGFSVTDEGSGVASIANTADTSGGNIDVAQDGQHVLSTDLLNFTHSAYTVTDAAGNASIGLDGSELPRPNLALGSSASEQISTQAWDVNTITFDTGVFDVTERTSDALVELDSGGDLGITEVLEGGSTVVGAPSALDFDGRSVTVSDDGDGVVAVDSALEALEDATSISESVSSLNFRGHDFSLTDQGSGDVDVELDFDTDLDDAITEDDDPVNPTGEWDFTGGLKRNGEFVLDRSIRPSLVTESVSIPYTEIPDGDHVAVPYRVPSGSSFELFRAGVQEPGGGSPSADLEIAVYNVDTDADEYNSSADEDRDTPWGASTLASVSGGTDLEIRIYNTGGSELTAGGSASFTVEGE